ncbi:MAG: amidase [Acidimicrobiia bacterium]
MTPFAEETRWIDATGQAELVRSGAVHPRELVAAAIERIEELNPALNAVVTMTFEKALAGADDPELPTGPFRGVPFTIKDLWAMSKGDRFTNGVRALLDANHTATQDTTLVARYRQAGLLIVGRTNTPELGILPTTEPLAFGATRNPWAPARSPGGSSGGSASAVASGMVPASHASDGGGSIRIPASCCGLVGLKVSQGRMSLGPFRSETALGVEHVVTRTVRDTAGLLDATHGPGVGDTIVAPAPTRPYIDEVGAPAGALRIGFLTSSRRYSVHPECQVAVTDAAAMLAELGHHVEEGEPAALQDESLMGAFGALWAAQTRAGVLTVERWLGRPVRPGEVEPLTWALAERAKELTADEYVAAQAAIAAYRRAVQQWWADGWDLLLTPTLAGVPPELGEMAQNADDPYAPFVKAGQLAVFTPPFNTTGQPAISLPTHWTPDGLPVGIQLVAGYGREDVLLRVAAQLEAVVGWEQRRPTAGSHAASTAA